MLDPALPVRPEIVIAQAVELRIDDALEPVLEEDPLLGFDDAFEDAALDALAEVDAGLGYLPETALPPFRRHAYVVAHEDEHALPPEEGGIAVDIAADEPGHEVGLDEEEQADRYFLV